MRRPLHSLGAESERRVASGRGNVAAGWVVQVRLRRARCEKSSERGSVLMAMDVPSDPLVVD